MVQINYLKRVVLIPTAMMSRLDGMFVHNFLRSRQSIPAAAKIRTITSVLIKISEQVNNLNLHYKKFSRYNTLNFK